MEEDHDSDNPRADDEKLDGADIDLTGNSNHHSVDHGPIIIENQGVQNHTNNTESIRSNFSIADAATTLLYASSFNILIYSSIENSSIENNTGIQFSFWIGLLGILFLFMDWAVRVGIPLTFPEHDQNNRNDIRFQLAKVGIEVCCIYFLVTFIFYFTKNPSIETDHFLIKLFIFFLIANYCWNFLTLFIMENLDLVPLLKDTFWGRLLKHDGVSDYTNFQNSIDDFEEKVTLANSSKGHNMSRKLLFKKNIYELVIQIIVFHIAFLNLILILALSNHVWINLFEISLFSPLILVIGFIIILIIYFVIGIAFDNVEVDRSSRKYWDKLIQSVLFFGYIIFILFSLSPETLILITIIEQVLMGVFLTLIVKQRNI